MAVTVWRGLARALRSHGVVVLHAHSAVHQAVLAAALGAARADIEALGYWATRPGENGPGDWEAPGVAGPVPVPGGCLLIIHAGNPAPPMNLEAIPGILAGRMREAGVADAQISRAPQTGGRYEGLHHSFGPAARAVMCGPGRVHPGQPVPRLEPRLICIAAEWLRDAHRPGNELHALIGTVEVPVTWDALPSVVTSALTATPFVSVISSDFATSAAGVVLGDCLGQGVALSAAGAAWPPAEITSHMRGLRESIRSHAHLPELSWAYVTADQENRYLWMAGPSRPDEARVCAAWYQLLSGDRLRHLGGPPAPVQLPCGRTELTVGDPEQWVPGHPGHDAVQAQCRRLFAPGD